ncbi:L-Cystine ABC transporter, periplasmic cystine-binding protein TcyK [Bacillus subtilis]|nr:L-Cystine ABC transporter, periplasmic cystine-binding protein TcyK [Bacillus subtilis]
MRTKAAFITILFSLITVLSACGADNQTTGAEQKKIKTIFYLF